MTRNRLMDMLLSDSDSEHQLEMLALILTAEQRRNSQRSQISDGEGSSDYSSDDDGHTDEISHTSSEDGSHDSGGHQSSGYSSDERSPKRRKTKETLKQDRISSMPDSILLHILSLLPTRDAVKTGALSHRWLFLWTSVPSLDFTCHFEGSDTKSRFATFVDQTLIIHKQCIVKKFTINFVYDCSFSSRVDMWVRFAARANVEELSLGLYGSKNTVDETDSYVLPQHLYSNSSIMKLALSWCNVVPNGLISWKLLKSLSIGYTKLGEDLIQKVLEGSSVLESLELYEFCGFNRLDIGSASLRKLVVRDYWDSTGEGDDSALEISAPNLQSLGILGRMSRKKLRLMNVQSLVDCNLNFGLKTDFRDSDDGYEVQRNMLRGFLDRLGHVKKLTLGNECIQVLSMLELNDMLSLLSKCKCLILDTCVKKCDLPGIAGLLQISPNLETLIINMNFLYGSKYNFDEKVPENYLASEKGRSKCLPLHLKTVKIVGFRVGHYEFRLVIPFVQFLLEKARVLEKIDINVKRGPSKELLQVAQKLLSLPRISPHAVVMLSE